MTDKMIILASDGVWDFFTPRDVIERCIPFIPTMNSESAAKKIVKDVASRWSKEQDNRDDITCMVIFISRG